MTKKDAGTVEAFKNIKWQYSPEESKDGFPWGPHKLPVELSFQGVSLALQKHEGELIYHREGVAGSNEKLILADQGNLLLSPVEPFHIPSALSTHLLVELEQPVVIEPRHTKSIIVTFPVELAAVYFRRKSDGERILDIFTLNQTKYTLYGSIKSGMVCKYWKSAVYSSIPPVNPIEQGVMKIEIQNQGAKWAEVQKILFGAQGMKIYYSPRLVCLQAVMKIGSEVTAETSFIDKPLQAGMKKALELFSARFLSLPGRTVMEEGY